MVDTDLETERYSNHTDEAGQAFRPSSRTEREEDVMSEVSLSFFKPSGKDRLVACLENDPDASQYHVHMRGYVTRIGRDERGFWTTDPGSIRELYRMAYERGMRDKAKEVCRVIGAKHV